MNFEFEPTGNLNEQMTRDKLNKMYANLIKFGKFNGIAQAAPQQAIDLQNQMHDVLTYQEAIYYLNQMHGL